MGGNVSSVGGNGSAAGAPNPAAGAGGVAAPPFESTAAVATPTLIRLSTVQWANSVRDLLKLASTEGLTSELTPDAALRFDNEADSLFVGQTLRDDLQRAAERLAAEVSRDPAAIARIMPAGAPSDAAGRAKAFVEQFGKRAFRRPLAANETALYLELFGKAPTLVSGMGAFEAGVRVVLEAFLQAPSFLYRTAIGGQAVAQRARLDDYEIASNISYAFTNTMPDDALFAAADKGELKSAAQIEAHARRLLPTEAGKAAVDRFFFQFFGLGQYDSLTKNPALASEFSKETGPLLHAEARRFLQHLYQQKKGLKDIYTSPVTFVNADVARLYDLPGSFAADSWTQVTLEQRPGLLTRLGFLAYYGHDGVIPDSIRRGVSVNQRILCRQMTAPENVVIQPLPPQDPSQTNREVVNSHTGPGTCGAGCHSTFLNPAGFAFESFDGLGVYRTLDNGKPVDASGSFLFDDELKSFNNVTEFTSLLAESSGAHWCYTKTWAANLYSRVPRAADEVAANAIARRSIQQNLSTEDVIMALVTDEAFVTRVEGPQ